MPNRPIQISTLVVTALVSCSVLTPPEHGANESEIRGYCRAKATIAAGVANPLNDGRGGQPRNPPPNQTVTYGNALHICLSQFGITP